MTYRVVGVKRLADWLTGGIFVLGLAIPAVAQGRTPVGPPPGAGPPANINPKLEERARQASEARLRSAEMEASEEAENQKHIQAAIANMKQDFTRIQVLRNDIARNLVAHKPLDYSLITEQTAEINKRAHRLNVYMLARVPENKEQNSASDLKSEEMIGALVKLCKLIDSFTENPALKNAAAIDAKEIEKAKEDKAKADRDLLAIMKLSESIQKKSDSLRASQ
jgi:hypothetical protein